jgi:hypothetical protein
MHKKSTPGKKTGARSRARGEGASLTVGTDSKAAKRNTGFSHIPPSVGEILFRHGLSQLGPPSPAVDSSLSNNKAETTGSEPREWLDWLRVGLPIELAPHVVQVLLKGGTVGAERQLVVFADSPAWCARLRYALLALEERIRARDPTIRLLRARVLRVD